MSGWASNPWQWGELEVAYLLYVGPSVPILRVVACVFIGPTCPYWNN